jgi:hypothetical protein
MYLPGTFVNIVICKQEGEKKGPSRKLITNAAGTKILGADVNLVGKIEKEYHFRYID